MLNLTTFFVVYSSCQFSHCTSNSWTGEHLYWNILPSARWERWNNACWERYSHVCVVNVGSWMLWTVDYLVSWGVGKEGFGDVSFAWLVRTCLTPAANISDRRGTGAFDWSFLEHTVATHGFAWSRLYNVAVDLFSPGVDWPIPSEPKLAFARLLRTEIRSINNLLCC